MRRLRTTAYRRLADLHLDPEDPAHAVAAEEALGSWAYSVVAGDRSELARGEVLRLVEAIEALGEARQGGYLNRQRGPAGTEQ